MEEETATQELTRELKKTNKLLRRYIKHHNVFMRGLIYGLGTAVGATLVVSIVLSIGIWVLSQLQFVPLIGSFAAEIVKFVQEGSVNGIQSTR